MVNFIATLFKKEDPNLKRLRELQQRRETEYKKPKKVPQPEVSVRFEYFPPRRNFRCGW